MLGWTLACFLLPFCLEVWPSWSVTAPSATPPGGAGGAGVAASRWAPLPESRGPPPAAMEHVVQADGQRFLGALLPPTYLSLLAGGMVQSTRSIFALECAEELGGTAKDEARGRLAVAASIGSLGEIIVGPVLGKLSDYVGRRPLFLFYALVPTLTRAVSLLPWGPAGRLRCLYVDYALLRATGVGAMMSTGQTNIL